MQTEQMSNCLTYIAPGQAELVDQPVDLGPTSDAAGKDGRIVLQAMWTGISRGTERLVFNGRVPESEFDRMRAPYQHGAFPFPVGYGYAWVGRPEGSADDRAYFGLFPHQEVVRVPADAVRALPDGLDPRRAVLAANMETALNIVWDAGIGPGDVVAVVGGGVLGLLVAGLASDIAGTKVTVIDINARRAAPARALGAEFTLPEAAPQDCDIVIHTSASEPGLRTALACAGMEATIVEASWFGTSEPSVPLGGAFHARRLTLKCSQVGMVSAGRRVRWSYARRLDAALALLCNDKYDALITAQVPFSDLPSRISEILDPAADGLATAVSYL